jgi:hypothetical protein
VTLPAAPVACPSCGGAARREDVVVEEARALCPYCRHEVDLAEPAAAAAGNRGSPAAGDLSCPRCGAVVPDVSVDLGEGLARCSHCTTVLDLSSGRFAAWYRRRLQEKERVRLPPGLRVTRSLGALTLEAPVSWEYPLGPAFLLGLLPPFGVSNLVALFVADDRIRSTVLFFDSILAAYVAFKFLHRRRFAVRDGALVVRQGGIPLPARRYPRREIEQVFVSYRPVKDEEAEKRGETKLAYDLRFLGPDGRKGTLSRWLAERDHAVFIERWIERRLGIVDRHVDGERS